MPAAACDLSQRRWNRAGGKRGAPPPSRGLVRPFRGARVPVGPPIPLHTTSEFCSFLEQGGPDAKRRGALPSDESSRNSADITALAGDGTELARSLPGTSRATASSGPRPPACSNQDQERAHAISHDFPPPSAARHRRHGACRDAAGSRRLRQGYRRRLRLCRLARRLRLQPGARRRRRRAEEDGRHQGGRGGEGPGNRRGREDHGVDDQSRRRHAPVSDLVRLLQPARAQARQQISQGAVRACRRAVDARRTRRTSAAISAISTRRSTSPASSPATPPRPASSASSPPSRSRSCCATSTPSCSARGSPIRTRPCR